MDSKKQFLSSKDRKEGNPGGNDSPWNKPFRIPPGVWGDILRVISAVAAALILYYVGLAIISEQMNFFLRHLVVLVIAFMFIAVIRAVRKEDLPIGKALGIFLFFLFLYNIANHYFVSEPKTYPQQAHYFPKDSTFGPGSHYIYVRGETPFIIHIKNKTKGYSISLQEGKQYGREVKFIFDDGDVFTFRRGGGGQIPYKEDPHFVLRGDKVSLILQVDR